MYQQQWNKIAKKVNFNLEINTDIFTEHVPFNARILDFGCGYGRVSKLLWDLGYRNIIRVDSSAKMIERGKREFPELQLEILEENLIPYPDSSFDALIACAVFTCITSQKIRDRLIRELYRVLKPEGILHMVEFCSEPSKSFTANIGIPMLYSTPLELKELACMLEPVSEEINNTKTMGGDSENSYSLFARK